MIDREKYEQLLESVTDGREFTISKARAFLDRCETPETERASGEWKCVSAVYKCTACGIEWDFEGYDTSPFCPCCGAKMKGDGDE